MSRSVHANALAKLRSLLAVSALAVVCVTGLSPQAAQAEVVVSFPSAAFLATVEPVYYEGHAAYWYMNRWRYRDGQGWHSYGAEPPYLMNRRFHSAPGRWYYGGRGGRGGGGRGGGGRGGGGRGGGGRGGGGRSGGGRR
jgi:uncharacterized membrane protein YgcG